MPLGRSAQDHARGSAGVSDAVPDRFIYSIRAGQRRAALPERAVTGPWRILVDSARAAAEEARAEPGTEPRLSGAAQPTPASWPRNARR